MKGSAHRIIVDAIATLVPEYVSRALGSFGDRLNAVEQRAAVPGPAGKDGSPGADGKNGEPGAPGRDGVNGTSVSVDELVPLVRQTVTDAIAALPPPQDGRDGQDGKDGRDGADGMSVAVDDVLPIIQQTIADAVGLIERPRDGADGKDGQPGRDGEVPPALLHRLEEFERERAEQVSTAEVLATFTALLRKEWAPILSPPQAVTIEKRVVRDSHGRVVGSIETRV